MKRIKLFVGLILILLVALFLAPGGNAEAATKFKYKDYALGKTVTYYGTVPTYIVDGITADLSREPAMISERGIAYASVNGLFRDVLGAKTKYTKSKKMITITYKGHVLKMYVGSTVAYLDGEEIEAPCAPFRIKYKKSKQIANLVPTRFVAETLGMTYEWNSSDAIVTIDIPFYYELNDETVKYVGTKGKITFNGEDVEIYQTPSLIISDTALISTDTDVFDATGIDFAYDDETGVITLTYGENSLLYCVGSRIVYVNGLLSRCAVAPTIFYLYDVEEDVLYIPGRFTMENLGFYYNWNSETGTSEISTFEYIDSLKVPEDVTGEDDQGSTDNVGNADNGTENNTDNNTANNNTENNIADNNSEISNSDNSSTDSNITDNDNKSSSDDISGSNDNSGEDNSSESIMLNTSDESTNVSDTENVSDAEDGNDNIDNTADVATDVDTDNSGNTVSGNNEDNTDEVTEDDGKDSIEDDSEKVTLPRKLINVFNPNEGYKFFIDRDNCTQTLKLPVPNGVLASDFEMNEELLGCLTELVLKGDYSDFYTDALVDNTGEAILQIQVYYDPNTDETIFKIFSDVVLGCGLSDADDNFINVRMDFVKNIYKKVIVMDAGHGGHDPGAQHQGYNESDLNLKIVLNCRELFKDTDIKVYYTRIDDTFLSLYDRAAFAELVGADMFIAVHHNSSWYDTVTGTSVYWGDKDTSTSLNGLTSEKLAWRMLENLTAALDTKVFGEGAINKNFVVVRDSKAPAVLLEIGFMSNSDELSRLVKDKFSKKVARTIVDTVLEIYEEVE